MSIPARQRPARARRLTTLAAALLLACAAHAQSARVPIDIAAEPLDRAIAALARQTGVQVILASQLAQGRTAPALRGDFTPHEGLERLLVGSGLVVRAQDATTFAVEVASPTASGNSTTLAEVKVVAEAGRTGTTEGSRSYTTDAMSTSTKLALSMRETPQAVSVVTRQRMDDQGMTSIVDVVRSAPGLYLAGDDGAGRPAITARGFYANVMYEGFSSEYSSYMPSSQANMDLFDRVEITRGATGLAQGRGDPSAAINMIHKRPTRTFQGSLSVSAGSWDDYGASIDLSGPVNEAGTLRARVVASGQDAHTFRDVEKHDHGLFYAVAEADLSDRTLLTVGAYRQTDFTNHWWYDLPISATGQHLNLPRSTFSGNDWEHSKNRVTTAFATLEHRLASDWKLRLATLQTWRDLDLLGTALYRESAAGSTYYHSIWGGLMHYRDTNYDASATGPYDLFGRTHQLVVGATHQSTETTENGIVLNPTRTSGIDIFQWDPHSVAMPSITPGATSNDLSTQDSVYAATHLNVTDRFKLLVGSRLDWYDYEDRTGTSSYTVPRNVTRYLGGTFDLDAQHTAYASYTDIFKPQSSKGMSGSILKPVVGKNYEVGVKGEYFSGALNATVALFQIDQENRARLMDDQTGCPQAYCYEASGLVRTKGIDLELQGAITPQWQVGAGYTYSDTRYVNDATASNIGKRFSTNINPQNMAKLSTMFRFGGEWHRWRAGGNVNWQSRLYADGTTAGVTWRNQQSAYAIADIVVGYQAQKNLDVQLNVTNLFDKVYYRAIGYSTAWGSTDIYGEPRKLKVTAKYAF